MLELVVPTPVLLLVPPVLGKSKSKSHGVTIGDSGFSTRLSGGGWPLSYVQAAVATACGLPRGQVAEALETYPLWVSGSGGSARELPLPQPPPTHTWAGGCTRDLLLHGSVAAMPGSPPPQANEGGGHYGRPRAPARRDRGRVRER